MCTQVPGDKLHGLDFSPSSKYEHRRTSALLRNIRNIRICMGKKPIVSVTYENERKQLTLLKMCVTSLLCDPRADLWPFYIWVLMSTVFSPYKGLPRLGTQAKRPD